MTGLENKLRAALRDTAGEIPDDPPPLWLPPARDPARRGPVWPGQRRWISWAAPLAAAALVLAVIAASLAVVHGGSGRTTSKPSRSISVPSPSARKHWGQTTPRPPPSSQTTQRSCKK